MSAPPERRGLHALLRRSALLFLALSGCVAAMGFSYYLVRFQARSEKMRAPRPERILRARQLRAWSNELVLLTNDFLAEAPAVPLSTASQAWVRGRFLPRALGLRRRIAAETASSGPSRTALLHAADRLLSLARYPEDTALRRAVLADVHRAATRTEQYLHQHGLAPFLRAPRELPAFAPEPRPAPDS